jgi:putative membrane protein
MLRPIIRTAITLFALTFLLPTVSFSDWVTLALASLVLTLFYSIIRPVLKLLTLPINIVTLGLFSSVINASLLWLTTYLVPGFQIDPTTIMGVELGSVLTILFVSVVIGFFHPLVKIFI